MIFSLIMGVVESLFAKELMQYLESYHAKRKADDIANAPVTKSELADSFK